jgi:hypothetical protein
MNRIRLALPIGAHALAGALLLSTPVAAERSPRQLADDLAFARELAVRYQYMDLAEAVLARVASERLSDAQKENLALVQAQVFTEGAKREGDPRKRLETFDKASKAFRDFFEDHPSSELRSEAERAYLGLVNNYGRALELALDQAVGDEATALRERTKSVLDDGLKRTSSLKEAYERSGLSATEKLEKWRIQLDRAQMLITQGEISDDPEFLFSRAEDELTRVAQEAGETSAMGLNACLALAKLNRARGRFGEAFDFAEFVVTTAVPKDHELPEWKDLAFAAKEERFRLVELALPELVGSLLAQGKMADAARWSLYFYNAWKREGFTLTPLGTLGLLSAARALLDAGGYVGGTLANGNLQWFESEEELQKSGFSGRDARSALELALKTAQDVNTENKGNTLQVRAQKLISDVIGRPGVVVPPDVLFEAALGEFNTKSYVAALDALKTVMRALDERDEATRREYMPKVLFHVGQSYAQLQRPLEGAMAFRDGATTWSGDPEYQAKLAQGFYREIGSVRRGVGGDKRIEELYLAAERMVTEALAGGGGVGAIKWRQAERAYDQKDYAKAREGYLGVDAVADEHEKALVKAALCLYKANDKDGAKREFAAYLSSFVPDPKNAITGARKLAAREEAKAQATYYLGKMAYDTQAYDEVLAALGGYETKFPDQIEYAPNALYMVAQAQLAKKDVAAAKGTTATMQKLYASNRFTGLAAFGLYQALKSEHDAALQRKDAARASALKPEMARYVRVSNQTANEPTFGNLRVESTLWLELGEFVSAEETLRATLKAFEGKAERAADLEKFVLPDLGEALLGQKRVPEALAVLDPLVPKDTADTRKPSAVVVRDWCKAVAGWVEGEGLEVPGVGGDFKRATELLDKLIDAEKAANEAWSCPWYALKFEQVYAFLQWSKSDSSQRSTAKRLIDDIASQLGDPDFKDVAAKCGDEVLRKRFLWLRNQLR